MGQQIKFFDQSVLDLENTQATLTVVDTLADNDGSGLLDFLRNRKNDSAWLTTGSADANNTTLTAFFDGARTISDIIIIGHNLKAYTIKYWDSLTETYVDFATPIAETADDKATTTFNFASFATERIQIVITGTQVADSDKFIQQLIVCNGIGQLSGYPQIKRTTLSLNKKINKMLSGKRSVVSSTGSFSCTLTVANWNIDSDLTIIEEIYFKRRGVLIWLCGGDETQFSHKRLGYRLEDIYFVQPTDDYNPDWFNGIYTSGMPIKMNLAETIE